MVTSPLEIVFLIVHLANTSLSELCEIKTMKFLMIQLLLSVFSSNHVFFKSESQFQHLSCQESVCGFDFVYFENLIVK